MAGRKERLGKQRLLTAFGETKSIIRWVEDSRCSITKTALMERLKAGYSPEEAVSAAMRPTNNRYEAFGESKLLAAWHKDPRCRVSFQALVKRVRAGMQLEEALTTPMVRELVDMEAFGERKRLKDWAKDPRCRVTVGAVCQRLRAGMGLEEALTRPPTPKPPGPNPNRVLISAFGESKTCAGWAEDPRCAVTDITLKKRLQAGMDAELAITMTSEEFWKSAPRKPPSSPLGLQKGFGEEKTFEEWARDPRCLVSTPTIMKRVKQGMSIEEAITSPAHPGQIMLAAFGEVKSVQAWGKDPRAAVGEAAIIKRLVRGFPTEAAITDPPSHPGTRLFWDLEKRGLADPDGKSLKTFAAEASDAL